MDINPKLMWMLQDISQALEHYKDDFHLAWEDLYKRHILPAADIEDLGILASEEEEVGENNNNSSSSIEAAIASRHEELQDLLEEFGKQVGAVEENKDGSQEQASRIELRVQSTYEWPSTGQATLSSSSSSLLWLRR